jgi:hypothetical protein
MRCHLNFKAPEGAEIAFVIAHLLSLLLTVEKAKFELFPKTIKKTQ